MNLKIWETIWTLIFFISLLLFAGMAIWVTIGGLGDIKRLFARMDDHHEDTESSE